MRTNAGGGSRGDRAALLGGGRHFASYGAHENSSVCCLSDEAATEQTPEQLNRPTTELTPPTTTPTSPQSPMTEQRKTLLMRAAGGGMRKPLKVEDIFRKGIDIAREFNATEFSGQRKVIQLVVREKPDGGCAFPDVRVVSGGQAGVCHDEVVIDMPDDTQEWHRRRNLSNSSKAPLISDV